MRRLIALWHACAVWAVPGEETPWPQTDADKVAAAPAAVPAVAEPAPVEPGRFSQAFFDLIEGVYIDDLYPSSCSVTDRAADKLQVSPPAAGRVASASASV